MIFDFYPFLCDLWFWLNILFAPYPLGNFSYLTWQSYFKWLKRFIPSEFGVDPDKVQISDLARDFYSNKAEIRRMIENDGIPYTFVSCNFFVGYLLPSLVQPGLKTPPRDKVNIFGDGNIKGPLMNCWLYDYDLLRRCMYFPVFNCYCLIGFILYSCVCEGLRCCFLHN